MNNTDLSAELVFNNLKDSIQSMAKDLLKGKIDKKAYTQTDAS